MKQKILKFLPKLYITWSLIVIALTFMISKLNNDNITHIIIAILLVLSLFVFRFIKVKNPKRFYILSCVSLAAFGEGAYMISKPVFNALLVPMDASFGFFLHNWIIDLIFTIPAYFFIFWTMWKLLNKFNYSKWEYIFFFALGQALGDGFAFFIAAPAMILLIPYVMLNYHAVNVAPFLKIESSLVGQNRSNSKWKYLWTPVFIILAYLVSGTAIKIVAKILNVYQ